MIINKIDLLEASIVCRLHVNVAQIPYYTAIDANIFC